MLRDSEGRHHIEDAIMELNDVEEKLNRALMLDEVRDDQISGKGRVFDALNDSLSALVSASNTLRNIAAKL